METLFIIVVILVAFIFEFINGFHDAANSIATIVSTGILTPRQAVLWAAFFNCAAFIVFHLMVANTLGNGLIDSELVNAKLILSALLGAIFWNLATWYYGLPSSSSHALIGGLAGATIVKGGFSALKIPGLIKVLIGIIISPLLGLVLGFIFAAFLRKLTHTNKSSDKIFKGFQLASSAFLSLSHGSNDAQKTMGIISILLFSASWLGDTFYIPLWVVISCYLVMGLGTLTGGWRIVHVMGSKITTLNPLLGCAAETGAAIIICMATEFGVPVSTTHTVTGAITGVGLSKGASQVHFSMLRIIVCAWLLTVPIAGTISAILMYCIGS